MCTDICRHRIGWNKRIICTNWLLKCTVMFISKFFFLYIFVIKFSFLRFLFEHLKKKTERNVMILNYGKTKTAATTKKKKKAGELFVLLLGHRNCHTFRKWQRYQANEAREGKMKWKATILQPNTAALPLIRIICDFARANEASERAYLCLRDTSGSLDHSYGCCL